MIKEEQEHPQMPCAVFCRTVPCPRVLHSAEPSCVWVSCRAIPAVTHTAVRVCAYVQSPDVHNHQPLWGVSSLPEVISFVCTHREITMCVFSRGPGRLEEAMQEELLRVWHGPWKRERNGWSSRGPSSQQSVVAFQLSCHLGVGQGPRRPQVEPNALITRRCCFCRSSLGSRLCLQKCSPSWPRAPRGWPLRQNFRCCFPAWKPEHFEARYPQTSFLSSFLLRVWNKQGLEQPWGWVASKNIPPKS